MIDPYMIDPLKHYGLEDSGGIYDEEAMTSLELAARTAKKVNEVIKAQGQLRDETAESLAGQEQRLDAQDDKIQKLQSETLPAEVERELRELVDDGTFTQEISKYAGDLEDRVNAMLSTIPEGSTTMDAEIIDARIATAGYTWPNLGEAVRNQFKEEGETAKQQAHDGVHTLPLHWLSGGGNTFFRTSPAEIPEGGISMRISEPKAGLPAGCSIMWRPVLYTYKEGAWSEDPDLMAKYSYTGFGNRIVYIPHIEGARWMIRINVMKDGKNQITTSNIETYEFIKEQVRVYAGRIKDGGNLYNATLATLVPHDTEVWSSYWSMRGFIYKFSCACTPLPLKYAKRVTCNPDMWMTAKVYHYDPATRTTAYVKTMHANEQHPCFGTECVVDFSEYGDNDWAILAFGRVPLSEDYQTVSYNGGTKGTRGVMKIGLDLSNIANGVHVEWAAGCEPHRYQAGSPVVQDNIALLKGLKHTLVPGRYGDDTSSDLFYFLDQNDFAGVFYGGGFAAGTFWYNVDPVSYFTSLLNPNSCAYGDSDRTTNGERYGIVCSAFTSLMHGYPVPLSTFDMRYNPEVGDWFKVEPLSLPGDAASIKPYDIITQSADTSGHSVMVTGVSNLGDIATGLHVLESSTPTTKETFYLLHNGINFYKTTPGDWFSSEYDFIARTNPHYDKYIGSAGNWYVPYNTPQRVMCSRGYGSVYVKDVNRVLLSIEDGVDTITITVDGAGETSYKVEDITTGTANNYHIVDITDRIQPGTIRIRNNVDEGIEVLHYISADGMQVSSTLSGNELKITVSNPEDVKYVNVKYRKSDRNILANMQFVPKFVGNTMTLPAEFTCGYGTMSMYAWGDVDYRNYVNVVFKTEHGTNTYAIDAQGDVFN